MSPSAAVKRAFLTLDLEPDHCDLVERNRYDAFQCLDEFLHLLRDRRLPLTVFATGAAIRERPDALERLAAFGAEIELHAYGHKRGIPGMEEIERGAAAYVEAFGRRPKGYRAPLGMITRPEIECLSREGFLFDSSLFPSFFPGRFCNVSSPTSPFIHPGTRLLEIPISVVPRLRFPVSLSYIQLAGFPFFRAASALFGLPEMVVIDFHLHDIHPARAFDELSSKWKLVYSRAYLRDRSRGLRDFARLVDLLAARGYSFGTMLDLYTLVIGDAQA